MTGTEQRQPWLVIIGIGEDGASGLCDASKKALEAADHIFGSPRQLDLADVGDRRRKAFPVPFDVTPVVQLRGTKVVMLASGDPFWFGAGASIIGALDPGEWICYPGLSTFSLAASRLGWSLDDVATVALHARPFEELLPVLQAGQRAICLVRDGAAVAAFASFLQDQEFGESRLVVLEALGGPREHIRDVDCYNLPDDIISHPVAVAVEFTGSQGLSTVPGRSEDLFHHDGQITKSPVRAVTLAALAPREGEILWDLGAGSGSVSVEWCLATKTGQAFAVEQKTERVDGITSNIARYGLQRRMTVMTGTSLEKLADLPRPDAVFIGGGAKAGLIDRLWQIMPAGTRLVVNAVTIETEALLAQMAADKGGDLLRMEMSRAQPIGPLRGWQAAYPVTQWSVIR